MPSHLILLIPQLTTIAKVAGAQLKDPVMKALGLDSASRALRKANESFLEFFEAEYERRESLATLLREEGKKSVATFIATEATQELLAEPLRPGAAFSINKLSKLWEEIRDSDGNRLISLPSDFDWPEIGRRYIDAVQDILATIPELREIWTAKNTNEIKKDLNAIAGIRKKFDLHEYRTLLLEEFGTLKLSALHADLDVKAPDRVVSLESIYIPQRAKEAFPPRDVSRDYRRKLEAEARLYGLSTEAATDQLIAEYERAPIRELSEILEDPSSQRLVLLGDPGLGKSTLLQHIALQWAGNFADRVPFLIELRKYTRDHAHPKSFLEFMEKGTWSHFNIDQGELDRFLRETNSFILFDGLDEIFDESLRGNVVAEIINFVRNYGNTRVVVTTRVMGYVVGSPNPELFQRAGFRQFTLQDFDFEQIKQFAQQWHDTVICDSPDQREELKERLLTAIRESEAIKELASNPLLLTLMALLGRRKKLPRERLKLYDACAELLVEGWDAARHLEQSAYLTHEDKIEILQRVAFEMQHEDTGLAGNMVSETCLKRILKQALTDRNIENPGVTARKIVGALAERDFMLCFIGDEQFAFVHRTFLEYFCAREYKSHLENAGGAEELLELFCTRWQDDAWHEVFRLICAMVGPELAARLVRTLLSNATDEEGWRAVFLAADCIGEVRQSGKVEQEKLLIRQALFSLLEFTTKEIDHFQHTTIRVRADAVRRLARGWPDISTHDLLRNQADAEYYAVRDMAVDELSRGWPTDVTKQWLLDQAVKSQSWRLRQASVHGLLTSWKDETTRKLVLNIIDSDSANAVRNVALREYVATWPEHANRNWLVSKAVSHQHPDVRATALSELTMRYPDEATRNLLVERISSEPDLQACQSMAIDLAYNWPKELTSTKFVEWAESKGDPMRRAAAITVLARVHGRLDLVQPYIQDEATEVRKEALKATMLFDSSTSSVIKELIVDRVKNDKNIEIRSLAIEQLARKWPDRETWGLLTEIASKELALQVRQVALREIWRNWHGIETQQFLMNRAIQEAEPQLRLEIINRLMESEQGDIVCSLLVDRYAHDTNTAVKELSFRALKDRFAEHPDVVQILKAFPNIADLK